MTGKKSVGLSHAVSRESTKILCSEQNDQTSEACPKVLRDLNFVHRRAVCEPCTGIEVDRPTKLHYSLVTLQNLISFSSVKSLPDADGHWKKILQGHILLH